ncbi:hypothetical protein V5799_015031 [Amblyomma americanum]|uniref:Monocarboxylate transporter n=1 Tax=Amblyomma americanum TaxID=6943 RepID=A0AAQ4E1B5_AMBAM
MSTEIGTAVGMIMLTLSIYNMLYFDKYRATASGFKYTGMTLAPLAFPLLLSALIREYGLHGALLMLAAITLNTLPVAMLMNNPRPIALCCGGGHADVQKVVKRKNYSREEKCDQERKNAPGGNVLARLKCGDQISLSGQIDRKISLSRQKENEAYSALRIPCDSTAEKDITHEYCTAEGRRPAWKVDQRNGDTCHVNTKAGSGTDADKPQYLDVFIQKTGEVEGDAECVSGNSTTPVGRGSSTGTVSRSGDTGIMALLRNPVLYILVATFTIGEYTTITLETTVLDYAGDRGAPRRQAEPIITYVATAEMVGRLVIPFFWDRARLSRCLLVAMCLVAEALCLVGLPHATTFPQVVAAAVVTGLPAGCVVALKPVLLSDFFGVEKLSMCWGVAGVFMLPVAFGGPLLIGLFRDSMGSYENLYRMLAALCVTCATVLFGLDFTQRRAARRRTGVAEGEPCTSVGFRPRSFDSGLDSRDIY